MIAHLFAHLAAQAARQGQNCHFSEESGTATESQHLFIKPPREGSSRRISYRELGRQVLGAARAQVRTLRARVQEVQTTVLINDWKKAEELWAALLADCKTPLFGLGFLEELWGIRPGQPELEWSLTRNWHQFIIIEAEIEIHLARRQSLLELSNVLERRLGDWLRRFGEILERIDEESAA